jgi:Putative transposase
MDDGSVTFQYKDYRLGDLQRTMTLSATEFIRRFLLHVLPKGFQRIRQYGFLANRARAERLDECRRLLGVRALVEPASATESVAGGVEAEAWPTREPALCPVCRRGYLRRIQEWRRGLGPVLRPSGLVAAIYSP